MDTKLCGKCNVDKDVSEFYSFKDTRNKNGKGVYLKWLCKECDKKYGLKYKARSREKKREYLWNHKKNNPCVDCGQTNPIVLQLDHVIGNKVSGVADMCNGSFSFKKFVNEINKCEVRCANCHMIKTAKDQEWYRDELKKEGCSSIDELVEKLS